MATKSGRRGPLGSRFNIPGVAVMVPWMQKPLVYVGAMVVLAGLATPSSGQVAHRPVTVSYQLAFAHDETGIRLQELTTAAINRTPGFKVIDTNLPGDIEVDVPKVEIWHGRIFYAVGITEHHSPNPEWVSLEFCDERRLDDCAHQIAKKVEDLATEH